MSQGHEIGLEQFFARHPAESRALFESVRDHVTALGDSEMRVTESQVAWRRRVGFAWAWVPGQYLGERTSLAPLVLTIGLDRRDPSPRWKQVVEPSPGRFVHHLELRHAEEIDAEVDAWLAEAFAKAE